MRLRRTLGLARRLLNRNYHAVPNYFGRSAYKLPDLRTLAGFGAAARGVIESGRASLYYDRLYTLDQAVQEAARRFAGPLTLAEVGVWKGGTSRFLLEAAPAGSQLHGFDTFEGHDARDIPAGREGEQEVGSFADTSFEGVSRYLSGLGATLYRGRFADTCGAVESVAFHVVHLDVDIYQPMKHALDFFRRRVEPGGIIVVDDYGFTTCPGVLQAVDEFRRSAPDFDFVPNLLTGQCRIVRLR